MGYQTIKFCSILLLMIILKGTVISGNTGYEYYWRDYDFENIPNDALEVGPGSNTYVAQVYVYEYGIFVGTLHPGEHFLEVTAYGDRKPTENIKILCTANPPESNWLNTTKEDYQTDVIGQYPVTGGWDSVVHAHTTIGRTLHEGSTWIAGSISSYANDIWLNYAYGGQEFKTGVFQVLVNPRVNPPSK